MFTVCSVQLPPFREFKAGEPKEYVERETDLLLPVLCCFCGVMGCLPVFSWCLMG